VNVNNIDNQVDETIIVYY